jgi:hypothetical protein
LSVNLQPLDKVARVNLTSFQINSIHYNLAFQQREQFNPDLEGLKFKQGVCRSAQGQNILNGKVEGKRQAHLRNPDINTRRG